MDEQNRDEILQDEQYSPDRAEPLTEGIDPGREEAESPLPGREETAGEPAETAREREASEGQPAETAWDMRERRTEPAGRNTYNPNGTEDERPVPTYGSYGSGSYQSRSSYSADYSGPRNEGAEGSSYRSGSRDYRDQSAYTQKEDRSRYSNNGYGNGRTGYSSNYDSYRFQTEVDPSPIEPKDARFRYRGSEEPAVRKKSPAKIIGMVAGFAVLFGVVAALVFSGVNMLTKSIGQGSRSTASSAEAEALPTPSIKLGNSEKPSAGISDIERDDTELTTIDIVDMCMPSMVAITNTTVQQYQTFFGQTVEQDSVSAGSGIIVGETESDYLIATNNHVIADSKDITVTFIGDEIVPGAIKGADADADLAIVAVSKEAVSEETRKNIRIVTIGDSDSLRVGETVVAIGNALGYGQSVSRGIISALNREVTLSDGNVHLMIQTDASINPGNSGGALLNMQGELIGINEIKYVNAKVEGVGYAIPMKTAEPILTSLGSKVQRQKVSEDQAAYIGIKCIAVPAYYVQSGYPEGVYVSEVTAGGPAEAAGLKEGDVITAIDGSSVTSSAELINYLEYYAAGEVVDFSVSRLNEKQDGFESVRIPITLGNRKDMPAESTEPQEGDPAANGGGVQNIPFLPNN
ncbi:MAG: trypsin-like peptidase domain-containing protein [Lachnospiraceae bacterium]|nr:trypsin-like peptidase domain-containing protein [Lachnospiraceae bacterium]